MKLSRIIQFCTLIMLGAPCVSHAALATSYQFSGVGNWSLDACGGNSTPTCTINALVPIGSTIEAAFLYTSMVSRQIAAPTVNFDGTVYTGADWTSLGTNPSANLVAFRTDVTSQISAVIGGGSASPYIFNILSEEPTRSVDGELLAIVYSNPNETFRTLAFLDGYSDSDGDRSFISIGAPLGQSQLAEPDFEATLSLGIGFSAQQSNNRQSSIVEINGVSLTNCAGGSDDGELTNGGLITVGGIGDSRDNDHNCAVAGGDDELYSLESFLSEGDSLITIDTLNPSGDDNIFFAGISITAQADISDNPNPVPAPTSLVLFGLGFLGLSFMRKSK